PRRNGEILLGAGSLGREVAVMNAGGDEIALAGSLEQLGGLVGIATYAFAGDVELGELVACGVVILVARLLFERRAARRILVDPDSFDERGSEERAGREVLGVAARLEDRGRAPCRFR